MKNIGLIFSKVIHKIKFNFKNILIVYVIIFFCGTYLHLFLN